MKKRKRFNKTTGKRYALQTIPHRVTKQTKKQILDSKNLDSISDELNNRMKDMLIAANGVNGLDTFMVNQLNRLQSKIDKQIAKLKDK